MITKKSTKILNGGKKQMANKDIRCEIAGAGLRQWQVADKIGIANTNFSRLLRKELSDEKKAEIRVIIEELKRGEE